MRRDRYPSDGFDATESQQQKHNDRSRTFPSVIARARNYLARESLGPMLIRAVGGSGGISLVGMGFTFLLGWQLAIGLGASGYGIYGIAMAVVSILGVPSQFGLPQLLTREVASANATRDWVRLKGVIGWSWRIAISSSVLIAILMWCWIVLAGPGLQSPLGMSLAIASGLVPVVALVGIASAILRGMLQVVVAQVPESLVRPATHSFLLFIIATLGLTLTPAYAMVAGIIGAACSLIVGGLLVIRYMPAATRDVRTTTESTTKKSWLSAAIPMALTEGLRVIQGQAAVLALGLMVSMEEVGQFRVASSLMTLLVFPLSIFNLVAAPHVSSLAATGDWTRLQRMLAYMAMGMSISVVILALPFAVGGEWLIVTIFGHEFAASSPLVLVLAFGAIANGAFGAGATALNMLGHHNRVTRASAISVSVLCALLWPTIAAWGAIGAATSVTAALTLWSVLLWWDARRLSGIDIGIWAVSARMRPASRPSA